MEEKEQTAETILIADHNITLFLPAEAEQQESGAVADEKATDYTRFTKKDFVKLVTELTRSNDWKHIDTVLREVRPQFDELRNRDRKDALDRFTASGSKKEDFEYRVPDADSAFDATCKLLRDRLAEHHRSIENQKLTALHQKQELLERLRALVDGEDTEHNFNRFKQIQREWKAVGSVPANQSQPLWASYTALVDRFYDQRSIYFELKDLDRKRNLEAKLELCGRAERLADHTKLNEALRDLNELHNEFRHIGPVPIEEKEALWTRFKAASDRIYALRDAHEQELQKVFAANTEAKAKLAAEIQPYAQAAFETSKEWNQKTLEVLEIQKKWEAVGVVPRARAKELNKLFWHSLKTFFLNKRNFFKKVDAEREQNVQKKRALIEAARQLQGNTDWEATLNTVKELQQTWKQTGPVPEKLRESLFAEFKTICDQFFDQRKSLREAENSEQQENLKTKEGVCEQLEKAAETNSCTIDQLNQLQATFQATGFVPRAKVNALRTRYETARKNYIARLPMDDLEKTQVQWQTTVADLKTDPHAGKKLAQMEQGLRKKLQKAEHDLATLKNNLEFFGRSKKAEKLKEEFSEKMLAAADEVKQLKEQLKALKTIG